MKTIPEMMREMFGNVRGESAVSLDEIKRRFHGKHPEINLGSVIPSDYCYNIINKGAKFNCHLFLHLGTDQYQIVGEGHSYRGDIRWKGEKVGEWSGEPLKFKISPKYSSLFKL